MSYAGPELIEGQTDSEQAKAMHHWQSAFPGLNLYNQKLVLYSKVAMAFECMRLNDGQE